MNILIIYMLLLNGLAIGLTVYDKHASKRRPRRRVPEGRLFGVAILGGSLGMWLTMRVIRHKTLHREFMVGLPVIFIVQGLVMILLSHYI